MAINPSDSSRLRSAGEILAGMGAAEQARRSGCQTQRRTTSTAGTEPCCKNGIRDVATVDDLGRVYSKAYCTCERGQARRYALPAALQAWSWRTYPGPKEAVNAAGDWLAGPASRWMLLSGPYGTGKTGLAVCIYKQVVDEMIERAGEYAFIRHSPRPAQFWRVPDLIDAHKGTFDTDLVSPMDSAERAAFLVLDDVGSERLTEFNVDLIAQLIQRRYTQQRRTVLTTNYTGAEMRSAFGERVFDRLLDATQVISFKGKSLRKRSEPVVAVLPGSA